MTILISLPVGAGECFDKHLKSAIKLNKERRPLYSALTNGASEEISDLLIKKEKKLLFISTPLRLFGITLRANGVPIGIEEFISMDETPEFSEKQNFRMAPLSSFKKSDAKSINKRLKKASRKGGFSGLAAAADLELKKISSDKDRGYHCLLRHFLESIVRIANLAPKHMKLAQEYDLNSPKYISKILIHSHYNLIKFASMLDEKAAPIQAQGIPMLCQDVPYIPPHSTFYQ